MNRIVMAERETRRDRSQGKPPFGANTSSMEANTGRSDAVAKPIVEFRHVSWANRAARRVLLSRLQRLNGGRLTLVDADGTCELGDASAGDLHAELRVHRPGFYQKALWAGELGVADSYLAGDWECDDLTSLFRLFLRDTATADGMNRLTAWVSGLSARAYHHWHANHRRGSRRNIEAHYDLGNALFDLMLDDTMSYSSGIFPAEDSTLREASIEKMDRICRKLDLQPGDQVLEIGSGWGGFAIHAAANYGCRVTTTTISQEQYDWASKRIKEAGLGRRVTLLNADYRDLQGQFDKLVSIEMIEAVGHKYLDDYFTCCSRLLKPAGTMLIQGIVMNDQRHAQYLRSADFIQRYVFPGGCLPSIGSMVQCLGRATDLRMVHLEDFAPHYARTLSDWRAQFLSRLQDVRCLGYTERFIRLWLYYLSYCEAAFAERYIGVVQVQFDKPRCSRDPLAITNKAAVSSRQLYER
jgi:cyclopropane-fatty-acyl-phospholipid synthase